MLTVSQSIEPEATHSHSPEMESRVTLELFKREHVSIRELLEKRYHISYETSYNNPDNERDSSYIGNGLWSKHRGETGELVFDVGVGCACEHDCCGHLCSLRIHLNLMDGYIVVLIKRSYNY